MYKKKFGRGLLIAALMTISAALHAQEGHLRMTMEQAVLGRGLSVAEPSWRWSGDKRIIILDTATAGPRAPRRQAQMVFTRGNNLFWRDGDGGEHPITENADPNIVSGQSVSRNEFGINGGIFISPDSTKVAFYQKDESRVSEFPLLDITTRTGSLRSVKYPMNGMASELVRLGVYDFAAGSTVWMEADDFDEERYLTNITWGPASDLIYIQVLDRAQKNMHLNVYDASSGKYLKTLLTEHNDRFVEPSHPLVFLESDPSRFIYRTDNRHGYKNLYLCNASGEGEPVRLTATDADVEFLTQRGRFVYYYSAEVSPIERHLFKVDIKSGKSLRLTRDKGWHTCTVSPDGRWFSDSYTSLGIPRVLKAGSTDGKVLKEFFRGEAPNAVTENCRIESGTIKSADGRFDNHYSLVYPPDFDPSKKYPVILYVYGGPHSQLIKDTWHGGISLWSIYMAQHGHLVFTMDNRGTPNRGAEYEKAIHRRCGEAEMADQMEGIRWLLSHPWADAGRVGVHGWSYGGFMTISLAVNYPEIFKVAVAGGPVIDWKWYEIMYGERYMETEASNPEGFAATSLIPRAKDLKAKLLICQGAIDDTVLWQHSLSFVESCIKSGVQVDYFPYPTHPHNVRGKDRVHLMEKVTRYFNDYL